MKAPSKIAGALEELALSCSSSSCVTPSSLRSAVVYKYQKFNNYQQHDSQEFLRCLLEGISLELNKAEKRSKYTEFVGSSKNKSTLSEEFHRHFLTREDSLVVEWFFGQNVTQFTCKTCRFAKFSFQKFMDIPIYLGSHSKWNFEIKALLQKEYQPDSVDWNKCEGCGRATQYSKMSKIAILPKILVIPLQRINYTTNRKITDPVKFTENLDLEDLVDWDIVEGSAKYKLYAVSNHSGSLNFGHYYAHCLVGETWFEFNDSSVSRETRLNTSSSTGYVGFYKKIN